MKQLMYFATMAATAFLLLGGAFGFTMYAEGLGYSAHETSKTPYPAAETIAGLTDSDSLRHVCSAMAVSFDRQTEALKMHERLYRDRSRQDHQELIGIALLAAGVCGYVAFRTYRLSKQ
jgi:hypothetical protein